jgi:hypothetical protein
LNEFDEDDSIGSKMFLKVGNVLSNSRYLRINKKSRSNYTSSRLFTSKLYQFGNFPEPKNATEGIIVNNLI